MHTVKSKQKRALDCSYIAVVVSCICALIQLYALPRNLTQWISLSNRVLMILWIVFVGWAVLKKVEQRYPARLAGALVLVALSAIAYFVASVNNPGQVVSLGLKLLGFLILPMMLLYSAIFQIDARAKTAILIFNLAASVVFIQLYNSNMRYIFDGDYDTVYLDVITLGYTNPNRTAMYLFLCAISLVAGVFYFRPFVVKAIFAADAACMAWFLQQTGARTAILLFLVFVALIWVTGKRAVSGAWINIALLLPLAYVLLQPFAENLTFMGESLFNGREAVYDRYLGNLTVGSFLLGDMNRFRFDNLHNGYLAISASVGVPACVGYVHLMKTCMEINRPRRGAPTFERVAFVGFLCSVMYTGAEAAFFVGGATYAMLVFGVCVLFAKARFVQVDEVSE